MSRQLRLKRDGWIYRLAFGWPGSPVTWFWNGKWDLSLTDDEKAMHTISLCALFWRCVFGGGVSLLLGGAAIVISLFTLPVCVLIGGAFRALDWTWNRVTRTSLADSIERNLDIASETRVVIAMARMKRTMCPLIAVDHASEDK